MCNRYFYDLRSDVVAFKEAVDDTVRDGVARSMEVGGAQTGKRELRKR